MNSKKKINITIIKNLSEIYINKMEEDNFFFDANLKELGKGFEYYLKEGLEMPNIPDHFQPIKNNNESNDTDSKDKKVNLPNKENINSNQDKSPKYIIAKIVYSPRQYMKKKREREDPETEKSPKRSKNVCNLTTNDEDKNKNDPTSDKYIVNEIKQQIKGEIALDKYPQLYNEKNQNKFIVLKGIKKFPNPRADDKYKKNWIGFLGLIRNSLNDIIKELNNSLHLNIDFLKNTNVEKLYQQCHKLKEDFINISFYEFLTYDPPKDTESIINRGYGSYNRDIIETMNRIKIDQIEQIDQTNQIKLFNTIVKLDINSIHKIFMGGKKLIEINGSIYDLSKFKIFNDYSKELNDILVEEKLSKEEIDKFLLFFNGKFSPLIKKYEELKIKAKIKELRKMAKWKKKDL